MDIGTIGSVTAGGQNTGVSTIRSATPAPVSAPAPSAPVQTANAVQQAVATPSMEQVKQAVDEINKAMQSQSSGLEFSVDQDTQKTIVKIVDQHTKQVIRQIPTEETLAIAKSLDQALGRLVREKA